jgi:hypothetical protein
MANLRLSGPHPLNQSAIHGNVPQGSPGVFVVGPLNNGLLNRVGLLGRADIDLARALERFIGEWPGFLFQVAPSEVEAFHLECALFHEIKRLDLPHPVRPHGTDLSCAVCGAWGAVEMGGDISQRVKQYRIKAREVRTAAETLHPSARLALLGLAESYERLAQAMESKRAPKDVHLDTERLT